MQISSRVSMYPYRNIHSPSKEHQPVYFAGKRTEMKAAQAQAALIPLNNASNILRAKISDQSIVTLTKAINSNKDTLADIYPTIIKDFEPSQEWEIKMNASSSEKSQMIYDALEELTRKIPSWNGNSHPITAVLYKAKNPIEANEILESIKELPLFKSGITRSSSTETLIPGVNYTLPRHRSKPIADPVVIGDTQKKILILLAPSDWKTVYNRSEFKYVNTNGRFNIWT